MRRSTYALVMVLLFSACEPGMGEPGDECGADAACEPETTPEASSGSEKTPVARCEGDIPFEPTYLPDGFRHELFEGPFPGGRPLDDPRSTGGKRQEQQVVVHYRGTDGRAIEIRRPGTLFSELALGDDAPTIRVLSTETANFAPTHPRGDDFIVQFTYPPGARPHQWCSLYSLNEYGVPLAQLRKVAEGLRPVTTGRSGRTFGWGAIPAGDPRICPTGVFADASSRETLSAARELLSATNGAVQEPRMAWSLLDRSLQKVFPSFGAFARAMRSHVETVYQRWGLSRDIRFGGVSFMPDVPCDDAVLDATSVAQASFPRFNGVSGGAVQLYFVARARGPKLWFAY